MLTPIAALHPRRHLRLAFRWAGDRLIDVGYWLRASRQFREPPILIGGCGRSGTTLLLAILSASPRVYAFAGETCAFAKEGYAADPWKPFRFDLTRLRRELINRAATAGRDRWCEKTPRNILYFDRIIRHFKGRVRLIHIVRDGRDVVTSVHPLKPGEFWVDKERWILDVGRGRELEGHPCVLTIRYEDLILEHQKTLERVCAFTGIPYDERMRTWYDHATIREDKAWFVRIRLPDASSIGRWKRPEYAARAQELARDPRAAELLRHYRYFD